MIINIMVFRIVESCRFVDGYGRFGSCWYKFWCFSRRWLLRLRPSGLRHRVVLWADTDVSEGHSSEIIKRCISNSLRSWKWRRMFFRIVGIRTRNCYNPEGHNHKYISFIFPCFLFLAPFFFQGWPLNTAHTSGWSENWDFRIAVSTINS